MKLFPSEFYNVINYGAIKFECNVIIIVRNLFTMFDFIGRLFTAFHTK